MEPDFELEVDEVNRPAHYMVRCRVTLDSGERVEAQVECADVMEALGFQCNAYLWNAFSYFWRHAFKNGVQDLLKMGWYINRHLDKFEGHERGSNE